MAEQRRPTPEARLLYQETPESEAWRLRDQELRKLAPLPGSDLKGRPTKRERRGGYLSWEDGLGETLTILRAALIEQQQAIDANDLW